MTKQNDKCKEDLDGRFLAESEDEDKKNPTDKRGYFAAEARETLTNMTVNLRKHCFWQGNEAAILSVLHWIIQISDKCFRNEVMYLY